MIRGKTMKAVKEGLHRRFENDRETAGYAAQTLLKLQERGLDAVR